jgi:hypothetical protein
MANIQNPNSLLECINDDGSLDDELLFMYNNNQVQEMMDDDDEFIDEICLLDNLERQQQSNNISKKRKREERTCFRIQFNKMRDPNTGEIIIITPKMSAWYQTYVVSPEVDLPKFINRFRRRFRCSYDNFIKLTELVRNNPTFQRWLNKDAVGREPSPLELLVLGALRYLGRGWTFDDLEENTSISEECHRQFFHKFIKWASTDLYKTYVIAPSTYDEAQAHMKEMSEAGFDGCVGSVDATHVCMFRCPYGRANQHRGHKESLPARTYNIVVNHRRRILHSTAGHPARWNDKTITMFDKFLTGLNKGTLLNDATFKLFQKGEEKEFCGSWLLCDNGYFFLFKSLLFYVSYVFLVGFPKAEIVLSLEDGASGWIKAVGN